MYHSKLNLIETEMAIKMIKDHFEKHLARTLNLTRVSSPLLVSKQSGINDYLNGVEVPVHFDYLNQTIEVVQSLAKWKRVALNRYGFDVGQGLYTDMNAIRKDEVLDYLHSMYVDQWDWEKIIEKEDRTLAYLKKVVRKIYTVLRVMEKKLHHHYPQLSPKLPKAITFIDSQTLENDYPHLSSKQREHEVTKQYKAVFILRIGGVLKSGTIHDGRSPDYDDWNLNGDLLLFDEVSGAPIEISSMGIRVDDISLLAQLKERQALDRLVYPYHQAILQQKLPLTIGGGIGQSRLCQFFLEKKHIGEVQASFWPEATLIELAKEGIDIL